MLSTIVMTLLGIWLALMIIGYLAGGIISYKMWKYVITENKNDK
jgi:hypothetical protein